MRIRHLGRTLQQAGVQVKHVTRIRFTAGRAPQQQRHLAIGHGLFRQIVVENHRVHGVVAEILAHRAAGVRRKELQRRGIGRGGGDDDGIIHRALFFQRAHQLRDGRTLLPDRDIDAEQLRTVVAALVAHALIDDRVDDHRCLTGLPVADDQLPLAAADRNQRVDRLQSGLHRLVHRFTRNDARGFDFDQLVCDVGQRPLAVDRLAQPVDHAAQQTLSHRHRDDLAGARYSVALADAGIRAEDNDADIVGFEIERHAAQTGAAKFHQFARHHVLQAEHAGNAVPDRKHLSGFGHVGIGVERSDLLLKNIGNLGGADIHHAAPFMARCIRCSRDFRLVS